MVDVQEQKDIESRLIWYQKAFHDPATTSNITPINTFDSLQYLYQLFDALTSDDFDLCICERERVCKCPEKLYCTCDSDDYFQVQSYQVTLGSNNVLFLELRFADDVRISSTKNIRIFQLHHTTQEEYCIADIVRTLLVADIGKKKKSPKVEKVTLKSDTMQFHVDGHPTVKDRIWCIPIHFMNYEHL